jgi:hypothetical protein
MKKIRRKIKKNNSIWNMLRKSNKNRRRMIRKSLKSKRP